ncbi:PREDICTED: putative E3 ubiquitin-protein ligase XBAT35 [Brassica oleracea var. oleracea]|nr:PREDICTED: putative E3 ubiquitin-protein ligase XBAT35 [Brassica oleracea var. oleracea]
MGKKKSKGELLYEQASYNEFQKQVSYDNSESIRALHRQGADLEWMDRKGRTPLIMACRFHELYYVAKTLIELGANVNAYCPARHAGAPLHHAAKRDLFPTVELLLSHGTNPLVLNDDGQTPLEVARDKGFTIVNHICLFSGWMREFYGPAYLDSQNQFPSKRVWVVVVPTRSRNPAQPLKLEVVVYDCSLPTAKPRTVMPLWKANLEEPITDQSDISVMIIVNESTILSRWRQRLKRRNEVYTQTHLRLAPSTKGDEQQLKWFCDACKGIPQPRRVFLQTAPSAHHAMSETPNAIHHSVGEESSSTAPPPPPPSSGKASTSVLNSQESVILHEHSPSAPPLTDDHIETLEDGPVHYPTIDSTPVDVPSSSPLPASAEGEKKEDGSSGQCSICLDAPSDVVCVPCGHLAGCMSCLIEIKSNNGRCPVCRAKIDQIIKLYRV